MAISIWIIRPWLFLEILIWASANSALSGGLVPLLCVALPTEWLVWSHIPVWAPIRRFFRRYGSWSGKSAGGRYRLIGNICFGLGVLSGNVLRVVFCVFIKTWAIKCLVWRILISCLTPH
ncbi:hypothetical protein BC827DRAFT_741921 [Russula dissimulans]|nr:hypothetical protein BC827DRAFT_741921 [Russula dissimulans]